MLFCSFSETISSMCVILKSGINDCKVDQKPSCHQSA